MRKARVIDGIPSTVLPLGASMPVVRELFITIRRMPVWWVDRAVQVGAGDVAWAVCYRWGLARRRPFAVALRKLSLGGKSLDTVRRQLAALERAGLVSVSRPQGRKPIIEPRLEHDPSQNCQGYSSQNRQGTPGIHATPGLST